MARPVIAHLLDGMPDEYRDYLICVPEPTVDSLAQTLELALGLSDDELDAIGARGRAFVSTEKGPDRQAARVLRLIRSVSNHGR